MVHKLHVAVCSKTYFIKANMVLKMSSSALKLVNYILTIFHETTRRVQVIRSA